MTITMVPDIFWYAVMSIIVFCAGLSLFLQVKMFRQKPNT
jgi:hypothetical protein